MNIVFMGTPDFARTSLEALIQSRHRVSAVFCQPDKPSGRGMRLRACAVKELAISHNIPVFQPKKLRDGTVCAQLRALQPDVLAVVAYGRLLPPDILALPPLGCVNVHASLLPALRGAAPIQWAIVNGLTESGVTTQYMAEEMDAGDIILQSRCPIHPDDTAGSLHDRLQIMGAALLLESLDRIESGTAPRQPQNHQEKGLAPLLRKEDGHIDWRETMDAIDYRIRGLQPWPGAYGGTLRIHSAAKTNEQSFLPPGTVLPGGRVVCGDGVMALLRVQQAGGKPMGIEDYLRGHSLPDSLDND